MSFVVMMRPGTTALQKPGGARRLASVAVFLASAALPYPAPAQQVIAEREDPKVWQLGQPTRRSPSPSPRRVVSPPAERSSAAVREISISPAERSSGPVREISVVNRSSDRATKIVLTAGDRDVRVDRPLTPGTKAAVRLPGFDGCKVSVTGLFERQGRIEFGEVEVCDSPIIQFTD